MIRRIAGALAFAAVMLCAGLPSPGGAQTTTPIRNANGEPYMALLGCDGLTPISITNPVCVSQGPASGFILDYPNPLHVALPAPIPVTFTMASGSTGMMASGALSTILISGYQSVECIAEGAIPSGMSWTYESSDDASPNGNYHPIVGNASGSPGNQYSNDSTVNARWLGLGGRWFGILVTAGGVAGTGTLTIQCNFSNSSVFNSTISALALAAYGSTRRTSQTSGVETILSKTLDDVLYTGVLPSIDPLAGQPNVQASTALEACHVAANYSGSAGAANVYEVTVTNTDTATDWLLVINATTCPTSGATVAPVRWREVAPGATVSIVASGTPPFRMSAGLTTLLSSTGPFTYTPAAKALFELRAF